MRTLLTTLLIVSGVSVANAECRSYKSPKALNDPMVLHVMGDEALLMRGAWVGDPMINMPCSDNPEVRCYGEHDVVFFKVSRPNDEGAWIRFVDMDNAREHLWEAVCDGVVVPKREGRIFGPIAPVF